MLVNRNNKFCAAKFVNESVNLTRKLFDKFSIFKYLNIFFGQQWTPKILVNVLIFRPWVMVSRMKYRNLLLPRGATKVSRTDFSPRPNI